MALKAIEDPGVVWTVITIGAPVSVRFTFGDRDTCCRKKKVWESMSLKPKPILPVNPTFPQYTTVSLLNYTQTWTWLMDSVISLHKVSNNHTVYQTWLLRRKTPETACKRLWPDWITRREDRISKYRTRTKGIRDCFWLKFMDKCRLILNVELCWYFFSRYSIFILFTKNLIEWRKLRNARLFYTSGNGYLDRI